MKVFYKKPKTKTMTYRSYKRLSNEAFMVDIQNRIFQFTAICSTKKSKIALTEKKKMSSKKAKAKQLKKVVSEDQVYFKSGTSDQAIAKALHIVTDDQVN